MKTLFSGDKKLLLLLSILSISVLGAVIFLIFTPEQSEDTTAIGKEYLSTLDHSVPDLNRNEEVQERKKEEMTERMENGDLSVFSLFTDTVILGDSRAKAFSEYGFIPQSQCLAVIGVTCYDIADHVDEIERMQPGYIVLSYGLNDVEALLGGSPEGYAQIMKDEIEQLLQVSPDSVIVVNSILPVTQAVIDEDASFAQIPAYNAALESLCQNEGWIFVNNEAMMEEIGNTMFEPDGEHFVGAFYPVWAWNIASAMFDL